jgi:hypothetical protein
MQKTLLHQQIKKTDQMWVPIMLLFILSICLCFYHGYVSFYQHVFIFVMVIMLIYVNPFVFQLWSC